MLVPQRRASEYVHYIVRTEPGMRDKLMPEIEAALAASNRDRIIRSMRTMDEVRMLAYVAGMKHGGNAAEDYFGALGAECVGDLERAR